MMASITMAQGGKRTIIDWDVPQSSDPSVEVHVVKPNQVDIGSLHQKLSVDERVHPSRRPITYSDTVSLVTNAQKLVRPPLPSGAKGEWNQAAWDKMIAAVQKPLRKRAKKGTLMLEDWPAQALAIADVVPEEGANGTESNEAEAKDNTEADASDNKEAEASDDKEAEGSDDKDGEKHADSDSESDSDSDSSQSSSSTEGSDNKDNKDKELEQLRQEKADMRKRMAEVEDELAATEAWAREVEQENQTLKKKAQQLEEANKTLKEKKAALQRTLDEHLGALSSSETSEAEGGAR